MTQHITPTQASILLLLLLLLLSSPNASATLPSIDSLDKTPSHNSENVNHSSFEYCRGRSHNGWGEILKKLDTLYQSAQSPPKMLSLLKKEFAKNNDEAFEILNCLGVLYGYQGKLKRAEGIYRFILKQNPCENFQYREEIMYISEGYSDPDRLMREVMASIKLYNECNESSFDLSRIYRKNLELYVRKTVFWYTAVFRYPCISHDPDRFLYEILEIYFEHFKESLSQDTLYLLLYGERLMENSSYDPCHHKCPRESACRNVCKRELNTRALNIFLKVLERDPGNEEAMENLLKVSKQLE